MRRLIVGVSMLVLVGSVGTWAGEPEKVMSLVAVMDLKCGVAIDSDVCKSLSDVAISELVKVGKYKVIDRANRDKILAEQGFQQTGCVEDACTVEAGRLLGVGKIIVGSITKIGGTYLINLQLINVQTATVETTADEECKCELEGLIQGVRNASRKLMGEQPAPPAASQPQPPAQNPGDPPKIPIHVDTAKIADSGLFSSFQPDKSIVIIYRPDDGFWSSPKIYDGAQVLATLPRKKYLVYETTPGLHKFIMKATGWPTNVLNLTLIAGKTYFLQIDPFAGFYIKPPDLGLVEAKMYQKIEIKTGN